MIVCCSYCSHIGNSRALSFSAPSAINLEFSQVKFEEETHDWTEESPLNKSNADHRWLQVNKMCMLFVMLYIYSFDRCRRVGTKDILIFSRICWILLYFVDRASRYISLLMTNLTHFLYIYLLHLSTCFKQPHHHTPMYFNWLVPSWPAYQAVTYTD